jgi:hypothetical protein
VSSSAADFAAQRVGLAVQFLDQEVQPLAELTAAAVSRRSISVQVRPFRRESSSATSMRMAKRGGFVAGPVPAAPRPGCLADAPAGAAQRLVPALEEALLLALHDLPAASGSAWRGEFAQASRCARGSSTPVWSPSRARASLQTLDASGLGGGFQRGHVVQALRPVQPPRHHCSASLTDSGLRMRTASWRTVDCCSSAAAGSADRGESAPARPSSASRCVAHAQLDLAAAKRGGELFAQCRLQPAQLFGQLEDPGREIAR